METPQKIGDTHQAVVVRQKIIQAIGRLSLKPLSHSYCTDNCLYLPGTQEGKYENRKQTNCHKTIPLRLLLLLGAAGLTQD